MPYDNNFTGLLTRSERQRNDKDPSHTGSCEIDGKQFWIAAWVNEGKPGGKLEGKKYFSLKFKPKDQPKAATPAAAAGAPTPAPAKSTENLDEDVPF